MFWDHRLTQICKENENLSKYSTYEIGGLARFVAKPRRTEDIVLLLDQAQSSGMQTVMFGMGSNLLLPDHPDPETIYISMRDHIEVMPRGDLLYVSAGTPLSMLSLFGDLSSFTDYHFTFLLPGTLGGGVYMNAKYFDNVMCEYLDTVYYIDLDAPGRGIQSIHVDDCQFAYKRSIFQHQPWFITGADLKLKTAGAAFDFERINDYLNQPLVKESIDNSSLASFYRFYRSYLSSLEQGNKSVPEAMMNVVLDRTGKNHFDYPSCGSVFKNDYTIGTPVGKLVESVGLKGTARGNAMISPVHGNVIQNRGGATAADVIELIKIVQEALHKSFNFVPEPELVIVK
ncbi:FAD-binding protein [Paenibacillus motobuensis]|uniref:UDP-N-acetylmuramate dehydrogenase n=1 Tax=Paenibacillus TaxID=44249 RepID=UPI00203BDC0F|nr:MULTISPECIES: FAD-binding protein [Paenibacillus]MCM3039786.1 FAD-binding protein [Paenibacillus lutimineralis]MCM3646890.1 FAD-binding protein [Paenibacillus motobuensis]